MKRIKKVSSLITVLIITIFLSSSVSQALTLGENITIWDGMGVENGNHEDNEVEPGCVASQIWDLEGFFLDGYTLTMVGGYDFVGGAGGQASGDLFIDIDGNAEYGPDNDGDGYNHSIIKNTFGYDYVLDIDFASKTYDVIQLTTETETETESIYYNINQESNPWKYYSGGNAVAGYQGISFAGYWKDLADDEVAGLSGWDSINLDTSENDISNSHYAVAFDLSFLGHGTSFISHFTMACGNDDLMGSGAVPAPEPSTIILMCAGLLGLIGIRRIKR